MAWLPLSRKILQSAGSRFAARRAADESMRMISLAGISGIGSARDSVWVFHGASRTSSISRWVSTSSHKHNASAERVPIGHSDTATPDALQCLPGLEPTKPEEKPRVVVLGTGWAGCRLMKGLDTKLYDIVCISPRNHMVFTPLLASTCVGTLEFRSVAEPVSRIQPALSTSPNSYFLLAKCTHLDTTRHEIYCEAVGENDGPSTQQNWRFKVPYDKLIIAAGADALTFGIHGVKENAIFLREVHHAQEIRRKLLLNLMLSDVPGVRLVRGVVKDVQPEKIILTDGNEVPYGLLVWSTGVGPSPFIKATNLPKSPGGRIGVDEWLRIPSTEDVFAIGDCAGFLESTGKPALPALAQAMRFNYYPPCPQPELVLGLSPHSDGGGITILLQDEAVEGLNIKKNDSWIPVKPLPNALVVNIGDSLEIMSNGRYKSIEHRAITNKDRERISIVTLYSAGYDVQMVPSPHLVDEAHPCLYKTMSCGEYMYHFTSNKLQGKTAVDFAKLQC